MRLPSMLFALAASLCSLHAAVVVTPVATDLTGEVSYNYTVANDEPLSIISFELTLPVAPTSIQAPLGWLPNSFSSGSNTIVQWISTGPSSDIPAAGELPGFIIVAAFIAGPIPFEVLDSNFQSIQGLTAESNSVPEPSTFGLASIAIAAVPLVRRWRAR